MAGPLTALYGFVAWIATHVCYGLFILWAYIPESTLHELGITWYPNKYWAAALPCFVLVSLFATVVFYYTYSMMTLPPLEDLSNLIDEHSNFPTEADLACTSPLEPSPSHTCQAAALADSPHCLPHRSAWNR